MIRTVTLDCLAITDWASCHAAFARAFGFPAWYGRNLDAWIDCMSNLDQDGMSTIRVGPQDSVLLTLRNASALKNAAPEVLHDLLELTAICNWRRIEAGEPPLLMVACEG